MPIGPLSPSSSSGTDPAGCAPLHNLERSGPISSADLSDGSSARDSARLWVSSSGTSGMVVSRRFVPRGRFAAVTCMSRITSKGGHEGKATFSGGKQPARLSVIARVC